MLPALAGCRAPARAPGRAPLQHVVLIKLRDVGDTGALLEDSRRHLSAIPAVDELYVGRPCSVGRTGVDLDWDVAVIVGFADRGAYEAYLAHPEHIRLISAWEPRFEWIRVHDALEEPEAEPAGGEAPQPAD